jgi:hypothetical protein
MPLESVFVGVLYESLSERNIVRGRKDEENLKKKFS